MGRVQDAVTAALAAEIGSRREWDERPGAYTMYYQAGECHLLEFPVPDAVWESGPPAVVLSRLADAGAEVAGVLRRIATAGLHGAAFFSEVWMATAAYGSADADDLIRRTRAVNGRVSKLPDRVEARNMWAVDRAGISYAAFQVRGDDEVKTDVSYPHDGQGFRGDVPRALDKLVTALLGVDLPERQRVPW